MAWSSMISHITFCDLDTKSLFVNENKENRPFGNSSMELVIIFKVR